MKILLDLGFVQCPPLLLLHLDIKTALKLVAFLCLFSLLGIYRLQNQLQDRRGYRHIIEDRSATGCWYYRVVPFLKKNTPWFRSGIVWFFGRSPICNCHFFQNLTISGQKGKSGKIQNLSLLKRGFFVYIVLKNSIICPIFGTIWKIKI